MAERPHGRPHEVGVVIPLDVTVGASERGLVALAAAIVHSNGLVLAVLAARRDAPAEDLLATGWGEFDPDLDPVVEIETANGNGRVGLASLRPSVEAAGSLTLATTEAPVGHGIWLSPLPSAGSIRVRVRWPDCGIDAESLLDAAPLAARAGEVQALPPLVEAAGDDEAEIEDDAPIEGGSVWVAAVAGFGADVDAASLMPPCDFLPATMPRCELVTRDADLAIAVGPVQVYPTGFTFRVVVLARHGPLRASLTSFRRAARVVAVEVRLPDGRRLWNGQSDDDDVEALQPTHGASDDTRVEATFWIAGLPPSGPIEITCGYPGRGLAPGTIALEGGAVRAAAADALELRS